MFVDADRAGNLGDTYAYNNSRLKRKIDQGRFLQERAKQISGVWFQPYLVADSTFTLFQSLIKGFPYPPAPTNQKFNTAVVSARRVVEQAFGDTKRRFAIPSRGATTSVTLTLLLMWYCFAVPCIMFAPELPIRSVHIPSLPCVVPKKMWTC